MDPLSLTASVITIIQLSERIISTCKDYITTIQDAPRDLRAIAIEVGGVKNALELVELLKENHTDATGLLQKLQGPNGPLEGCREALRSLDSLLPVAECNLESGKRRKTLVNLKSLAWPLKKNRVQKILEDIGRYKATISLALTAESV
jgi:hypothetical protein